MLEYQGLVIIQLAAPAKRDVWVKVQYSTCRGCGILKVVPWELNLPFRPLTCHEPSPKLKIAVQKGGKNADYSSCMSFPEYTGLGA